ncbi:hypothetical protein ABEX78_32175 [Priestia megaterium]
MNLLGVKQEYIKSHIVFQEGMTYYLLAYLRSGEMLCLQVNYIDYEGNLQDISKSEFCGIKAKVITPEELVVTAKEREQMNFNKWYPEAEFMFNQAFNSCLETEKQNNNQTNLGKLVSFLEKLTENQRVLSTL